MLIQGGQMNTDSRSRCTVGCGRPAEGMCPACWSSLSGALSTLDWLVIELDVTLSRQSRYGSGSVGVLIRTTEQPLPVNLATSNATHQLRNTLTTWVRALHYEHAIRWQECDTCKATWVAGHPRHDVRPPLLCPGTWVECVDPLTVGNTLPELGRWLLRHPSWIRNHSAADQLHHDLTGGIRRATRAIDVPQDLRVFLGVCGWGDPGECPEELWAPRWAEEVICRGCGGEWNVAERREWMLGNVEDEVGTASFLSALLTRLGKPVTVAEIHKMARTQKGSETPPLIAVREDRNRRRYYRAGDVMELAFGQKVAS
jgi:hypothetical protein